MTPESQHANGVANRNAGYQENRIGVKGDPTPDHEYGDEPEHPRHHSDEDDVEDYVGVCKKCGGWTGTCDPDADPNSHMMMTFEPGKGEVPCGGEVVPMPRSEAEEFDPNGGDEE